MSNFRRVLRLAFRYRMTVVMTVICALAVAVLWGANIGTVYPFVRVAIQGESPQQWVAEEIQHAEQTTRELREKIDALEEKIEQAPAGDRGSLEYDRANLQAQLETEQRVAASYRWAKPYVDRYLPESPFQCVVLVIGLLLLGTIVKDLFLIANNVLVYRLAELAAFDLRKRFYRRTLRMDLAAFGSGGTADLMSRFTHDMQHVSEGLVSLFGKMIREPLKMAACLIGAAMICWRLLILSMLVAPIAAFLVRWLAKTLKRANRKAMEEMAQIYSTLEETFRGIKIVKAFTNERQERRRFHRGSKEYFRRAMRIAAYDSLTRPLTEVLGIMAICVALMAGAWLVLSKETHLLGIQMSPEPISLPALLLFYALLSGAADPIRKFSDVLTRLQRAMAASDRIFDRLDREPEVRDPVSPRKCPRHREKLSFQAVDFAYQPGHPVLEGIDLEVPFGSTVAIVGPNGCGKSTLANLVPRFHDPQGGRILLDGVPTDEVRIRDLRRQIGIVTQETILFDDTVLNNIRYGSPGATREQVVDAARRAHAHEFIVGDLDEGYETMVGTGGSRLSGGQRQRVALARAILRDPSILILDEATSQVDLQSEQAIQAALEDFIRDRTALIVTHRLAVLALADLVVVMQEGKILDQGTHEELLGRCGLYRRLHQIHLQDQPVSDGEAGDQPLAA